MTGNNMDNFTDDASPKAGVPTGNGAVEIIAAHLSADDSAYEDPSMAKEQAHRIVKALSDAGIVVVSREESQRAATAEQRQGVHEVCDKCGFDLRKATTECPSWHGLDLPCDLASGVATPAPTAALTEDRCRYYDPKYIGGPRTCRGYHGRHDDKNFPGCEADYCPMKSPPQGAEE